MQLIIIPALLQLLNEVKEVDAGLWGLQVGEVVLAGVQLRQQALPPRGD